MGMSGDEQHRGLSVYFTLYLRRITARVSAYMCHPYIYIFTVKTKVFRESTSDGFVVDITIYAF